MWLRLQFWRLSQLAVWKHSDLKHSDLRSADTCAVLRASWPYRPNPQGSLCGFFVFNAVFLPAVLCGLGSVFVCWTLNVSRTKLVAAPVDRLVDDDYK